MARLLLQNVVAQAALGLELAEQDKPLLLLACRYAEEIDAATPVARAVVLRELGPKLQAALESLGMSPAARAKVKGGAADDARPAASARDELRARRDQQRAGAG